MKTRNLILNVILAGTIGLSAISCDQNNENDPSKPMPDGEALHEAFGDNLDELTQEFTINATTGGSVIGAQGTVLEFGPEAFLTLGGDPVTGTVDIELIEVYSKARMALTEMATKGRNGDGDIATLISGGEFFVNATQGGNQLKPASGYALIAPTDNTGGADLDMGIFIGEEECDNNDCDIVWEDQDKDIQVGEREGPDGTGVQTVYYTFQTQFGWTNIDKWYSDPRPKTTIFVDVPEGYDDTNCAVYLSYDGEPTALAQFDIFDAEEELFTEHYGLIPIGLEVHFIIISIVDGQYNYAIQAATIVEDHIEVIDELQPVTEADLIQLINDLP